MPRWVPMGVDGCIVGRVEGSQAPEAGQRCGRRLVGWVGWNRVAGQAGGGGWGSGGGPGRLAIGVARLSGVPVEQWKDGKMGQGEASPRGRGGQGWCLVVWAGDRRGGPDASCACGERVWPLRQCACVLQPGLLDALLAAQQPALFFSSIWCP